MPEKPVNIGNIGGFARRAIEEGVSQREFTQRMRDAGADISRAKIREAFNETRTAMANAGDARGLPGHRIPSSDNFQPWQAGRPGRYAYQLNVRITDTETGESRQQPWMVISDTPISINKAQAIAIEQAEAGITDGLYENEQVDGARIDNLYQTVEAT